MLAKVSDDVLLLSADWLICNKYLNCEGDILNEFNYYFYTYMDYAFPIQIIFSFKIIVLIIAARYNKELAEKDSAWRLLVKWTM